MNEIKQQIEKEPRLEDFGLDVSVYENRDVKNKEEQLIEEKIVSLEKAKEKNEKNISRMDGVIAVWLMSFACSLFFVIPAVILNNFIEEYINLDLFIFIWISFILIFGWVWGFFEDVLDKIRKKKQEIERVIEKLQKRKEEISLRLLQERKEKIAPFETALREYWEQKMKDPLSFVGNTETSEISKNSSRAKTILDSVEEINKNLLTTSIDTSSYKKALQEKTQDDEWEELLDSLEEERRVYEAGKEDVFGENSLSSNESSFLRDVRNVRGESEKIFAPERLFQTPKKIDWEELNAKRKRAGLAGEEVVMEIEKKYLIQSNRKDLAQRVEHRSKDQGDGLGYDILSFFGDGREKYIEVKSTTGELTSSFYLSRNELEFLKSHLENAFIYKVKVSSEKESEDLLQIFRADEVVSSENMTPIQYLVKMKS